VLKYLEIWGTLSLSISIDILNEIKKLMPEEKNTQVNKTDQKNSQSSISTTPEVPREFIDPLTCNLMTVPVILPSGIIIDRSTLEKCINEDRLWARTPKDPFTQKPFTSVTQPVVAQQLKT
ncbi:unnamed protein product, partial [Didymodactylos carnosus]